MATTPSKCGENTEVHLIAGIQGSDPNVEVAKAKAGALFIDALLTADTSLRAYGTQPCPTGCPKKAPDPASPVYSDLTINVHFNPGAPAQPAVPAVPAVPAAPGRPGRPAAPAKPAVPARPAAWTCTIGVKGTVTFTCEGDG